MRVLRVLAFVFAPAMTLAAALAATPASAQRLGGQRFVPAGSEDGVLSTEGADRRTPLRVYAALFATYALDPVVVTRDGEEIAAPVEHLLALDLVATLPVWEGLEIGVGAPVTLVSSSADDGEQLRAGIDAPGFALGDLTLRLAYRQRLGPHTAIALHVPVLFPTTSEASASALPSPSSSASDRSSSSRTSATSSASAPTSSTTTAATSSARVSRRGSLSIRHGRPASSSTSASPPPRATSSPPRRRPSRRASVSSAG